MISLTRSLAIQYGRFNIRSNIVLPGTVRTPLWERRASRDLTVLEDVAGAGILLAVSSSPSMSHARSGFLASVDAAAAITGISLPVDCGLSAGNIVMARELTLENF